MSKMKLSEFSFDIKEEKIALYPTENRDEAKLMVINRKEKKNRTQIIQRHYSLL